MTDNETIVSETPRKKIDFQFVETDRERYDGCTTYEYKIILNGVYMGDVTVESYKGKVTSSIDISFDPIDTDGFSTYNFETSGTVSQWKVLFRKTFLHNLDIFINRRIENDEETCRDAKEVIAEKQKEIDEASETIKVLKAIQEGEQTVSPSDNSVSLRSSNIEDEADKLMESILDSLKLVQSKDPITDDLFFIACDVSSKVRRNIMNLVSIHAILKSEGKDTSKIDKYVEDANVIKEKLLSYIKLGVE